MTTKVKFSEIDYHYHYEWVAPVGGFYQRKQKHVESSRYYDRLEYILENSSCFWINYLINDLWTYVVDLP